MGAKFKDIEKTLQEIVDSKKFSSREQDEEQELLEEAPEKIHGPTKPTMAKSTMKQQYLLDQDEVNDLINASQTPLEALSPPNTDLYYDSYSMQEVAALIVGNYDPSHFERRR